MCARPVPSLAGRVMTRAGRRQAPARHRFRVAPSQTLQSLAEEAVDDAPPAHPSRGPDQPPTVARREVLGSWRDPPRSRQAPRVAVVAAPAAPVGGPLGEARVLGVRGLASTRGKDYDPRP